MQRRQIPNMLTVLRVVLAAAFFVVLSFYQYAAPGSPGVPGTPGASGGGGGPQSGLLWAAIVLFIVAATTDAADGYLARRWQVESTFGRIVDPMCDKLLVLGAFIYLAGPRFQLPATLTPGNELEMVSGVYPWMVVIILARELLVTGIRGELEGMGHKFPAKGIGKAKMILQSTIIPIVLLIVWVDPQVHEWTAVVRDVLVWATVIVSALSGWPYVRGAAAVMAGKS